MKLNRTGSNWTELERNKINENWRIIEGNYNDVVDKVSEEAFKKVVDSAKLNWKEPVDSFADLSSAASEGDTRMARDSGKVYRFNGEMWQEIQQIDAGPVNEVDRRLTEQLAQKATLLKENKTYYIGEEGDFSTLSEALEYLSLYKISFINEGYNIELKYMPGYTVTEQTTIRNIDLSYITISADYVVPATVPANIIRGDNAKLPNIKLIYDMGGNGATGIHLENGSSVFVHPDCGVINAGLHGIQFIESTGTINQSIFTNANSCGIRATQGSQITAMGADASFAGEDGFFVTRQASIHANEINGIRKSKATNCGGFGVRCGNGYGSFRGAILTDNRRGIVVSTAGIVLADYAVDVSNCEEYGVFCEYGGVANVPNIIAKNCEYGLYARYGGRIVAELGNTDDSDYGVFARHGAEIVFENGASLNNTYRSLYARDGSKITALSAKGTTADNRTAVTVYDGSDINLKFAEVSGVEVIKGSRANLADSNCQKISGEDGEDIIVREGSIINAVGSTGGLSQLANEITPNGIIFK